MRTIMAADIGGTNSRFAQFRSEADGTLTLVGTIWLPTTGATSFAELLGQLRRSPFPLAVEQADMAVLGVAGPVERGTYCAPPNIAWDIDLETPENAKLFPRACLINDFVAQAYACRSPVGQAAQPILTGEIVEGATIGVLGAGTALGKASLAPMPGHGYLALPSEGGHAYFPFLSPREHAFQKFYMEKSGQRHITGNRVISGSGLRYLHWFLTGEDLEAREVAARFSPQSETLAWAARFHGRVCRDWALEILALGGLYIAGGVAARNPEILTHENFRAEFLDSPAMGRLLANIPIFLIDNQDSGLWGAAFLGQQLLRQG